MSAATEQDWKVQARGLREAGLSEREVAESVGKANSTVHAYFKKEGIEPRADGADEPEPVAEPATPEPEPEPPASSNGHGHLNPFHAERVRMEGEAPIPGQADLDGGFYDPEYDKPGFEAEAGEAVGAMPPKAPQESVYVEVIRIDGTTQIALDFGGKRPAAATLRLSGKAEVDGFYRKGDRLRGTFEAVITGVAGKDKLDRQTGIVTEAEQSHTAVITDMRVSS
jgi:hypothetical protein